MQCAVFVTSAREKVPAVVMAKSTIIDSNMFEWPNRIYRFSIRAAKLVAALLRVAGVTAGLAESNGRLPPGL